MKTLIVGGTGFLGGAVTDAAVLAGHDTAIFTRGRMPDRMAPAGVEWIVGDRHSDLSQLKGRHFDLVVDTCAFSPDSVSDLLDTQGLAIGRYALISSTSVYDDCSSVGPSEASSTHEATAEQLAMARAVPADQRSSASAYGNAYGPLKRASERVAFERLGDQAVVFRAGLLVGAGDYTDRLTYWIRRIDQGGLIPAPGDPQRPVQFIDVRDAADFVVSSAANGLSGVINLTGQPMPIQHLLIKIRQESGSDARFVWRNEEAIAAAGLKPWSDLPFWLPQSEEFATLRHFLEVDTTLAQVAGVEIRTLEQTIDDILQWDRGRRAVALKAGMPAAKEAALLGYA